ncbi:MAG: hypothetical protein NC122_07820 [Faecalibacterium sp.]|nr:hypothetical protein [Ruminococcus sp.]MCM1392526.1 hypothetical protein [Ruminococcus sp.]MCM1486101.1 hypothetical protein [Faecalibacterium sp.]
MTRKKFSATLIALFILILVTVPTSISFCQSVYHKLIFNVTTISGEIKDDVAHVEISGTVKKRFTDLRKYDDKSYMYGPIEGGDPQMYNVEVYSDSFNINSHANEFTAYVDIDLIKEYGEEYNEELVKLVVGTYVKSMWLCAADSNKEPYKYGSTGLDNAVLYMEDYEQLEVQWK